MIHTSTEVIYIHTSFRLYSIIYHDVTAGSYTTYAFDIRVRTDPALDEGGEVQHIDFIERMVAHDDQPVLFRHRRERVPDPVVLRGAVLRENIRVELALAWGPKNQTESHTGTYMGYLRNHRRCFQTSR